MSSIITHLGTICWQITAACLPRTFSGQQGHQSLCKLKAPPVVKSRLPELFVTRPGPSPRSEAQSHTPTNIPTGEPIVASTPPVSEYEVRQTRSPEPGSTLLHRQIALQPSTGLAQSQIVITPGQTIGQCTQADFTEGAGTISQLINRHPATLTRTDKRLSPQETSIGNSLFR